MDEKTSWATLPALPYAFNSSFVRLACTFPMTALQIMINGEQINITRVSFQPLKKAMMDDVTKVSTKNRNSPIFSPMPSWILSRSLEISLS